MSAAIRPLLAALVVAALVVSPAAEAKRRKGKSGRRSAPEAPYVIERLEDGLTLVVVRTGGPEVSLRYVVKGGAFDDPAEKAGVAHLVEHLVFHGSYDFPEGRIEELARQRGAHVSAVTSTTSTTYALDAPREAFLELVEPYVQLVTNPALQFADLEREKKLIEGERRYEGVPTLVFALDQLVFPADNRGRTVLGSRRSRAEINAEDLVAFYEEHYTPANSVAIVVGDVEVGAVQKALQRAVLQPPVPAVSPRGDDPTPNAPASAKVKEGFTGTASGYALGEVDPRLCEDVAALLELRVLEAVRWRDSLASEASVRCQRLRGQSFVVAYALAKDAFGSRLPDVLQRVMEGAGGQPMTKAERGALLERHQALRALERHEPDRLAEALATRITALEGSVEENLDTHLERPKLDWEVMRPLMLRALSEERRVLVHFSPYEG